jgi:hypothetical protein
VYNVHFCWANKSNFLQNGQYDVAKGADGEIWEKIAESILQTGGGNIIMADPNGVFSRLNTKEI